MENKTFLAWLKLQPMWIKVIVMIAIGAAAAFGTWNMTACSASYQARGTKVTIDTAHYHVRIKTNNGEF